CNKAESNYGPAESECFAIVRAVEHFDRYLAPGFEIITDHSALQWILSQNFTGKLFRWSLFLSSKSFTITHREGKKMTHADALSRNPIKTDLSEKKSE